MSIVVKARHFVPMKLNNYTVPYFLPGLSAHTNQASDATCISYLAVMYFFYYLMNTKHALSYKRTLTYQWWSVPVELNELMYLSIVQTMRNDILAYVFITH